MSPNYECHAKIDPTASINRVYAIRTCNITSIDTYRIKVDFRWTFVIWIIYDITFIDRILTRTLFDLSFVCSSLPVSAKNVAESAIPIQTPSTGMNIFNFDSLMEGGTGLTPVAMPSHNRNPLDLATPNTPSEATKLVSL